jgi:hypothetical protein
MKKNQFKDIKINFYFNKINYFNLNLINLLKTKLLFLKKKLNLDIINKKYENINDVFGKIVRFTEGSTVTEFLTINKITNIRVK